jgi:hypothetical protein
MSDWVSKEVERSEQRRRVKQRLDEEAADLARQYMNRERAKQEVEKQAILNTPEARLQRLESEMNRLRDENQKLRNGHQ